MKLVAVLLAGLVIASSAEAATVSVVERSGQEVVVYAASAGERNHLLVAVAGARVRISDPKVAVQVGPGCTETPRGGAQCAGDTIELSMGDGNDVVQQMECSTACLPVRVRGGAGDDALSGGAAGDVIDGGTGQDNLYLGPHDIGAGGAGSDTIWAQSQAYGAVARCGSGIDDVAPDPALTLARDCEQFSYTGWGRSTIAVRGSLLRLRIRTLGCTVKLRVGRAGRVKTAHKRPKGFPVSFVLPDHGKRTATLWGRSSCDEDPGFRRLFRVAPAQE